jgi:hypothetical protein
MPWSQPEPKPKANVQTLSVCYTRLIWARYRVYKYDRPDILVQKPFSSAKTLLIPDWTIIATVCVTSSARYYLACLACTGEFSIATNPDRFLSLTLRSTRGVLSLLHEPKRPDIESCNLILEESGIHFDTQIPLRNDPHPFKYFWMLEQSSVPNSLQQVGYILSFYFIKNFISTVCKSLPLSQSINHIQFIQDSFNENLQSIPGGSEIPRSILG